MYNNIGKKIKTLAKIACIIIAVTWVIIGFVLIFYRYSSPFLRLIGLLTIFTGPFFAWIGSFLLYGYGELIEQTTEIKEEIKYLTKSNQEKEKEEKETEKKLLEKVIMNKENDEENDEVPFYNPMREE